MKNLKTLISMQLKEKLGGKGIKDKKAFLMKVMLPIFAFILLTVFAFLLFYVTYLVGIFDPNYIPVNVLTFIFSLMMLLFIIFTTFSLVRNLYFSFDNQILITFPVSSGQVFISKLTVFYILELKRAVNYILPLFIGYGIVNSLSVGYFFLLPVFFILISVIPVIIAAFLSIPLVFLIMFLRRFKLLQLILAAIAIIGSTFLVFYLISLIPERINFFAQIRENTTAIREFFANSSNFFIIFALLTEMATGRVAFGYHTVVTGRSTAIFFSTLGICIALLTAAYFIIRPLYFKMVSSSRENRHVKIKKPKKNVKLKSYFSILKKEALLRFRTPASLAFTIIGVIILPVAMFLLNRVYGAFNMSDFGDLIALATNFLILTLIITSQHVRAASIFSSEGKAVYLLKTTPDTLKANVGAKMFFDVLLASISLLIAVIIITRLNDLSSFNGHLIFFSALSFMVGHICWSIELDITNPQYNKIVDGVHESSNINENKSMIIALIISFLISIFATFLMIRDFNTAWIRIALIAAAFVSIRTYLLVTNLKVYFKEM
ncbi:MAG: hypothetical protein FWE03_03750 [Firmicutes bacterium]|nr:hypothetical protein [Bacillota bacterium]